MKNLLVCFLFVLLSGCATSWDVALNDSDNKAIMNGQENSARIVDSKAEAISGLNLVAADNPVAVALFQVIKTQAIAGIETPMFEVKKARLNTDNIPEVMKAIRQGIPIITMGSVATTAIENDRGTTHLYSEGGDINMKDSLNRTEVHSVANDDSTASTNSIVDSSEEVDN